MSPNSASSSFTHMSSSSQKYTIYKNTQWTSFNDTVALKVHFFKMLSFSQYLSLVLILGWFAIDVRFEGIHTDGGMKQLPYKAPIMTILFQCVLVNINQSYPHWGYQIEKSLINTRFNYWLLEIFCFLIQYSWISNK